MIGTISWLPKCTGMVWTVINVEVVVVVVIVIVVAVVVVVHVPYLHERG
jgi:hypothetical protein